jgi:hypothetical protein
MRLYISLSFLVLVCLSSGYSQNLVPNGSMETQTDCPSSSGEINLATGWFSTLNSPDYYHSCNKEDYQSFGPNIGGSQLPFQGVAYSALVTKNSGSDYHEHQGIKLIKPLITGKTYHCRMWVSLCELSSYGSNNLGFQFGKTNQSFVNNISQVYTDSVIVNKVKWVLVAGNFVADFAYDYVFVGNFFEDANTKITEVADGSYSGAYFYIDSISVTTLELPDVVDIRPTQVPGKFKVTGVKENSSLSITRASGELVYSTQTANPNMEIDLSRFGHGTYCIIAESVSGSKVRKVIVY